MTAPGDCRRLLSARAGRATLTANLPSGEVRMYASPDDLLASLRARDPGETEFHQAVSEVLASLWPFLQANPQYLQHRRRQPVAPAGDRARAGLFPR